MRRRGRGTTTATTTTTTVAATAKQLENMKNKATKIASHQNHEEEHSSDHAITSTLLHRYSVIFL